MNELLRLATEIMEARENAISDGWEPVAWPEGFIPSDSITMFMALATNHAVEVIQGYQELIRRMIVNLEVSDSYVENNRCLGDANDVLLLDAIASIPQRK